MNAYAVNVDQLAPVVKRIASKQARSVPSHWLTVEDLENIGMEAVLRAAATYQPTAGPWLPYAIRRAQGSMIDEIRRHDPMPHPTRRVLRKADEASERLDQQHAGRKPTDAEIATEARLDVGELAKARRSSVTYRQPRWIDEPQNSDDAGELTLGDAIAGGEDPYEVIARRDTAKRLIADLRSTVGSETTKLALRFFTQREDSWRLATEHDIPLADVWRSLETARAHLAAHGAT